MQPRHARFPLCALTAWLLAGLAQAAPTTLLLYEDTEPDQAAYTSRILVQERKLRMDYGQDGEDFVLYDARAGRIYLVSREAQAITEIPAGRANPPTEKAWRIRVNREASGSERIVSLHLNDRQCVEFRSAPLLPREMALFAEFRQALSANQLSAWARTPAAERDPCHWLLDIKEAGIEYRSGLPMVIRYADGRGRRYRGHEVRDLPASLFALPPKYRRSLLRAVK